MNKIFFTILLSILFFTTIPTPIYASEYSINSNSIIVYAFNYEWRYKMIDGHLYKRQYNTTTQEWVGDWVFVA